MRVEVLRQGHWETYPEGYKANTPGYQEAWTFIHALSTAPNNLRNALGVQDRRGDSAQAIGKARRGAPRGETRPGAPQEVLTCRCDLMS